MNNTDQAGTRKSSNDRLRLKNNATAMVMALGARGELCEQKIIRVSVCLLFDALFGFVSKRHFAASGELFDVLGFPEP